MSVKTRRAPEKNARPKRAQKMPPDQVGIKPTGQLIAARRGREWASVIGWGLFLMLPFFLGLTALNGYAWLNAETKRKVELHKQIELEQMRYQKLLTEYQQSSASVKVMQWASGVNMVRVENQPAVLLKPVTPEQPLRNVDGSVLGALPD
jgi:hypothetical protein